MSVSSTKRILDGGEDAFSRHLPDRWKNHRSPTMNTFAAVMPMMFRPLSCSISDGDLGRSGPPGGVGSRTRCREELAEALEISGVLMNRS